MVRLRGDDGREARAPQRVQHVRHVLDAQPVQLDVLADRDVGDAPRVPLREIGDRPNLVREQEAVRNADAGHKKRRRPAEGAPSVSLRVQAPPPEAQVEVVRRDGVEAVPGVPDDVREDGPRIPLELEPLSLLRGGFLDRCVHHIPPEAPHFPGGRAGSPMQMALRTRRGALEHGDAVSQKAGRRREPSGLCGSGAQAASALDRCTAGDTARDTSAAQSS